MWRTAYPCWPRLPYAISQHPFSLPLEQVWGDGCFFEPFNLPGSKLEGIKAAFVDLLVRKNGLARVTALLSERASGFSPQDCV